MHVVLVVEPEAADADQVLQRLGRESIAVCVTSPLQAVYALHAVQFNSVIVAVDRLDAHDYATLFSTLRMSAPTTAVICAPSRAKCDTSHDPVIETGQSRHAALVA